MGSFSGGEVKLFPPVSNSLKLCYKIEIWYTNIHACEVSESIPFSWEIHLILMMSRFFCKRPSFLGKNNTFPQSNCVRAVIEIFSSDFSFGKIEDYRLWKY